VLASWWSAGRGAQSGGCGARCGGFLDLSPVVVVERVEVVFDAADQLPQPRDFGV
jgi:hypothetical protein